MTATLRAEAVSRAFGGFQALSDRTVTAAAGQVTGLIGPNGSGKTTLFNILTGYERADSGEVYPGPARITGARAAPGPRPRGGPHLPADPDLPPADRAGEHAGPRPAGAAAAGLAAAGRGGQRRPAAPGGRAAGAHRDRRARGRPGRHAVLRPAQAAGAGLRADRRPVGGAAGRAGRRGEPDSDQPPRRPDPGPERRGHDVPDRRAQHGLRDGPVRPGHRAEPRHGRRGRPAGSGPRRPAGAGCLPGPAGGSPGSATAGNCGPAGDGTGSDGLSGD